MGLRIRTNVASLEAQKELRGAARDERKHFARLSSGKRINRAADDAAGLAIASRINATNTGLKQAKRNASNGISMIQVAEGGLNEASNILNRMRELSIQSATDTVGENERGYLDQEFQQLTAEVERIAQSTTFNGAHLIKGDSDLGTVDFQVGAFAGEENRVSWDSEQSDATVDGLGIDSLAVGDKSDARDSIDSIDGAIDKVSSYRATLGSIQSRLTSTINNLESQIVNQDSAKSTIEDVDVAESSAQLASKNVLKQAGIAVLSQANNIPNNALRLLT
ncbi:MAG: flagellin FliC [Halobacteriovoraceae bacterium]|nr:flagellin FliC [Halobacteriovoraceae bacterium]